ncbi:hypothetical protein PECL_1351 [Pediococcus claussenii ATCC BAA-344]|uniref:Uncharacterized protein n=1 Tax=Pediococcus claussenii (strain ATCC BAA-344 / DSM 14800 / JCM 18046 / KCTC 3811 / LMG 21948 / P06) TaxID=701521 RepID=G8PEG8_PEDCP|nr:hypothetical protein PECL_1351 [Pediococcus claussenii ATCC BAA-344]
MTKTVVVMILMNRKIQNVDMLKALESIDKLFIKQRRVNFDTIFL